MNTNYCLTKESVDEYIQLAKNNSSGLINKLKTYLPQGSSLLEIGSGPGTDFQILKKDYQVIGSDFSEDFLGHLRTNNPKDEFLNLNAISLDTNKVFAGIYSNKVLQHLSDQGLKSSIKRQVGILQDGGIICHSFWKGEGDEIFKGMLVNYQNVATLEKLFSEQYEILTLEEYAEFDAGDSILLIAQKKPQP